jgi:hypothetical protein
MSQNDRMFEAICDFINVPSHIMAAASAIKHDLLYGPVWVSIPKDIKDFSVDHYSSLQEDLEDIDGVIVSLHGSEIYQAFQDFLDTMPTYYYMPEMDYVSENVPEVESIDDGEDTYQEEPYYEISIRDIMHALFGKTIAAEFHY